MQVLIALAGVFQECGAFLLIFNLERCFDPLFLHDQGLNAAGF